MQTKSNVYIYSVIVLFMYIQFNALSVIHPCLSNVQSFFVYDIDMLSCLQVNTLGGEADRLQQTHPQNATQIHLKRDELITNWEQIRTLAAERHARLNDSYRWVNIHLICLWSLQIEILMLSSAYTVLACDLMIFFF